MTPLSKRCTLQHKGFTVGIEIRYSYEKAVENCRFLIINHWQINWVRTEGFPGKAITGEDFEDFLETHNITLSDVWNAFDAKVD